jgi:hypothetical protein
MRYGGLSYAAKFDGFCTSLYQRRRLKRLGKRWRKG